MGSASSFCFYRVQALLSNIDSVSISSSQADRAQWFMKADQQLSGCVIKFRAASIVSYSEVTEGPRLQSKLALQSGVLCPSELTHPVHQQLAALRSVV